MIELIDVVKEFRNAAGYGRSVRALDGVSIRIDPGTALGVVGLNGAGKSTLLRLLLGYARATSGTVSIAGLAPRTYAERFGIAYVPERATIPPKWTVERALKTFAMFAGTGHDAWDRVAAAIDRLGLAGVSDRRVGELSKGNLQRVAIAQAILAERGLMVLDEPTDGLDPVWIAELRAIIREWRDRDPARVVVLASHGLHEVERLTDRVVLLHNGTFRGDLVTGAGGAETLEHAFLRRVGDLEEARP